MEDITRVINEIGINNAIITIFALLFAIKQGAQVFDWFCERVGIETKWTLKQKQESDMILKHEQEIVKINDSLKEIRDESLGEIRVMLQEYIVATGRSTLFRLHKEIISQESVSEEELKTFLEVGAVYQAAGGDDIYHSKLEPEVLAMPIRS